MINNNENNRGKHENMVMRDAESAGVSITLITKNLKPQKKSN